MKKNANERPDASAYNWFQSQKPGGSYAWIVWSIAAISFGYAFFHRVAPSVMVSDLMAEFGIGGATLGTLSALYFYPYVLLQIPLGAMLETVGARLLLSSALLLAGLGSIVFGLADQIALAYLGRILIGIGCSVGFLASLALAAKWFPANRFAFLAGLSMFSGMLSGVLAQGPLAIYIGVFGWRQSQYMLGAAGLILAVLVFFIVRNAPFAPTAPCASMASNTPTGPLDDELNNKPDNKWPLIRIIKDAGSNKEVWKISLVAATLSAPMLTLGGLWGTPFLMHAYQLSRPDAAFLLSFLLLGWAFGAPAGGWFSDYIGRRRPILVGGCLAVSLLMTIVIFVPNLPLFAVVILFIFIGIAGGTMTSCFALVRDIIPQRISSGAIGIVNSMTVASGAVLQPLVGLALDYQWSGERHNGVYIYSPEDYRIAFILILITSVIGLITSLRLTEKPKIA